MGPHSSNIKDSPAALLLFPSPQRPPNRETSRLGTDQDQNIRTAPGNPSFRTTFPKSIIYFIYCPPIIWNRTTMFTNRMGKFTSWNLIFSLRLPPIHLWLACLTDARRSSYGKLVRAHLAFPFLSYTAPSKISPIIIIGFPISRTHSRYCLFLFLFLFLLIYLFSTPPLQKN